MQEADKDIVILESHSEELPLQEADEDIRSYIREEADEHIMISESHSEELPLQKTVGISENQEAVDGTKAVLDNSSETLLKVATKDFESLSEENLRNTLISNMQTKQHANEVSKCA